ncbi:MAG TPA: bifunctional hydroxymethylpyrimidine kinase/phosphomethylpyrimidine kinase [Longimicrobiales bacterium]|nr:bifunctional hydroxymethylpyrimidine kinase/phosphomethylpyrimidine kinase [Longimicrobiales bacterium]
MSTSIPNSGPPRSVDLPVALSIAGSDSGGGAGIQADLKTFHAFGVFGTTAITALTAQDTTGVHGVHAVPVDMVRRQIQVVAADLRPSACKSGMLATAELVEAVAEEIVALRLPAYVLDPVMVATSGDRLLDRDAESAVSDRLLPLCAVVTPNLEEAALLVGVVVGTEKEMTRAGRELVERGAGAALVKGGHLEGGEVVDVLVDAEGVRTWRRPKIETRHTHGTGCTLSAAIAAGLAHGRTLREAVDDALDFAHRAIATAPGLGAGHGPLNHFVAARR